MEKDLSPVIQRVLAGEFEAFEEIVEACQKPVYNLAFRLLQDHEDAKDVAQEAFLRAFRNLSFYDSKRPFIRWLLAIVYNLSMDCLRRRTKEKKAMKAASFMARHKSQSFNPSGIEWQELLNKLEEGDRAIVILKYWHGFTCSEIGEIVGLGEEAVKARLHRARLRLADELRREGWLP
ncbi:MAG: sigma-70 family RNA polymerase sigma factor [Anaerolineae bacterium]|nr:sigma-70 family RNA polymerase sigma factor [Anaerolineae bacterium]MDW8101439.1 sigma-70 family RNA polymerase sigma factor [Anaerolineae bacterium]